MNFGRCPHTGLTFVEKFARAYEALPSPSSVTAEVQAERAAKLEEEPCKDSRPCTASHRYLFVMINNFDNKGGFHTCPRDVKECVFVSQNYPAEFRWFVIDPTQRDEVRFLYTQIDRFWDCLKQDDTRDTWWHRALAAHADIGNE